MRAPWLALVLFACGASPAPPLTCEITHFPRSPGGVPEVAPEALHPDACGWALVDVRERDEVLRDGHIAGVRWVPLTSLVATVRSWPVDTTVVLVDRSGRRAGRAVAALEHAGRARVAALTGGMLLWERSGLAVSHDATDVDWSQAPTPRAAIEALPDIHAHLSGVPITEKAARLFEEESWSCVDGRETGAVLGTPGGEGGTMLTTLAAVEQVTGTPVPSARVPEFLDAWIDAFGRIYLHTDDHALERLGEALVAAGHLTDPSPAAVEALIRHPPASSEELLLDLLVRPEHTGCGHLRLILQDPTAYRVRPGLVNDLIRSVMRRLWERAEDVRFVVLHGDHHERAVVEVIVPEPVRGWSEIPVIDPAVGDHQVFVHHPQVERWMRQLAATFVAERAAWLVGVSAEPDDVLRAEEALAAHHLDRTLRSLASGLPIVRVEATPEPPSVRPTRLRVVQAGVVGEPPAGEPAR